MYATAKYEYEEYVKTLADTRLYEEAFDILLGVEEDLLRRSGRDQLLHFKNGTVYSEFIRRDKGNAYLNAVDKARLQFRK